MGKKYHLKILEQGISAWNIWIEENPNSVPDLIGINLEGANLEGANLKGAILGRANLESVRLNSANLYGANLYGVNLYKAKLHKVNLSGANLKGAKLGRANLYKANLYKANLEGASLERARLYGTNFERAILSGANLKETILSGANLKEAILSETNLEGASLERASLEGANLKGANLEGANLKGANLEGANLKGVNLEGAKLSGAVCYRANFKGANLKGANFEKAILSEAFLENAHFENVTCGSTVFANVVLIKACGLETCRHFAPSSLDPLSLIKSGMLPKEFLKGIGWPNWQIEAAKLYLPKLRPEEVADITNEIFQLHQPIQLVSLFISYSHKDADFVNFFEKRLDRDGIRYWRDVHDAPAGPLERSVFSAIGRMGSVLLVLSESSTESDWVEAEVEKARKVEKAKKGLYTLCPIALDRSWEKCTWPERLVNQIKKYNILDFSAWQTDGGEFERQYAKLKRGLHLYYQTDLS